MDYTNHSKKQKRDSNQDDKDQGTSSSQLEEPNYYALHLQSRSSRLDQAERLSPVGLNAGVGSMVNIGMHGIPDISAPLDLDTLFDDDNENDESMPNKLPDKPGQEQRAWQRIAHFLENHNDHLDLSNINNLNIIQPDSSILQKYFRAMEASWASGRNLQEMYRKMGMRRCDCKTMLESSISRKKLLEAMGVAVPDEKKELKRRRRKRLRELALLEKQRKMQEQQNEKQEQEELEKKNINPEKHEQNEKVQETKANDAVQTHQTQIYLLSLKRNKCAADSA